jgi:hypothetical protein
LVGRCLAGGAGAPNADPGTVADFPTGDEHTGPDADARANGNTDRDPHEHTDA